MCSGYNHVFQGDSGLEHNVVLFGSDGKKYPMDSKEFDGDLEKNLEGFMKKVIAGEVKPFVRSAPVPRDDKGPVRTVVALNFDEVVGDESKDVVVELYSPMCDLCEEFEPKYKALATKFKKTQPNLIFTKYDGTLNEIPYKFAIKSFPSIFFVPSGRKSAPIKYGGNREEKSLSSF
ncbi:thioredoxin [Ostertagia ostertagi]